MTMTAIDVGGGGSAVIGVMHIGRVGQRMSVRGMVMVSDVVCRRT